MRLEGAPTHPHWAQDAAFWSVSAPSIVWPVRVAPGQIDAARRTEGRASWAVAPCAHRSRENARQSPGKKRRQCVWLSPGQVPVPLR